MAAFHVGVRGLVRFLLLIGASNVLALPTANEESEAAIKVSTKAEEKIVVDYRGRKCMPPIATEFTRGSDKCVLTNWAQPAVFMAEYLDCMSTPQKVLRNFSMEQVLECALPDLVTSCAMMNVKRVSDALDYILYAGISLNDDYKAKEDTTPYNASDRVDTCHATKTTVVYKFNKGYRNLMPFDEKNMAQQVRKTGPIIATLYFDASTIDIALKYKDGLLNTATICPKTVDGYSYTANTTTPTVGAAYPVMVVGYGTLDGVKVWIVRNDWYGSDWGMGGYFYLERGINACNIGINPMRVLG